jgi:hypothetical protein
MSWYGWVILVGIVLWLFSKGGSSSTKKGKSANRTDIADEAEEIANKVETIKQFQSLERKLEKLEDRMDELTTEKAIENASHKYDVLQEAINIAASKKYQWQYIPSMELTTPKSTLEIAYKIYSAKEYEEIIKSFDGNKNDWYGIDAYDEKDDPEPFLKSLLKFRAIVESTDPDDIKASNINKLASNSKELAEEFFDTEGDLKPGDQWFAEILSMSGVPLADKLYSEGYTTVEKCLAIDSIEFSKRKGVGPKTVEKLKQFQLKNKKPNKAN